MTTLRGEDPGDRAAIHDMTSAAFENSGEADLIDRLRAAGALTVSLVALENHRIVGHIAFSPASLDGAEAVKFLGLGPMAVSPENQNQGIGSALVEAGLAAARKQGHDAVVVLGHREFYPRFGFAPASRYGLHCKYGGGDAFMALELSAGAVAGASGVVHYHPAFDEI